VDDAAIPELVTPAGWWARLWYKTCPACEARFPNDMWQMSVVGYPMHYAIAHLGIKPFTRPR
jgi:hypothetical protein